MIHTKKIVFLIVTVFNFFEISFAGDGWTQVSTTPAIKNISVGPNNNQVWAAGTDGNVYRRTGVSSTNLKGDSWMLPAATNSTVFYVSVGATRVWLLRNPGTLQINYSDDFGSTWNFLGGNLTGIAAGPGDLVWGLNATGIPILNRPNTWTRKDGTLALLSVGLNGMVWGVNSGGNVYFREGVVATNPYNSASDVSGGTGWTQIPGTLSSISAGQSGQVWGVDSSGQVFVRVGVTTSTPKGSAWVQVPGSLKYVSVGSNGETWGINASGAAFFRNVTSAMITTAENLNNMLSQDFATMFTNLQNLVTSVGTQDYTLAQVAFMKAVDALHAKRPTADKTKLQSLQAWYGKLNPAVSSLVPDGASFAQKIADINADIVLIDNVGLPALRAAVAATDVATLIQNVNDTSLISNFSALKTNAATDVASLYAKVSAWYKDLLTQSAANFVTYLDGLKTLSNTVKTNTTIFGNQTNIIGYADVIIANADLAKNATTVLGMDLSTASNISAALGNSANVSAARALRLIKSKLQQ